MCNDDKLLEIFFIVLFLGGLYFFLEASCEKKWAASGMRSSFSVLGGCQLEVKDGIWLPEKNYRDLETY